MLGNIQFAGRIAESAENQHQGHQGPRNLLIATRHGLGEKLLQSQCLDQLQTQPGAAEVATVLHPHTFYINLDPLGTHVIEKMFLLGAGRGVGRLVHAEALRFIELP